MNTMHPNQQLHGMIATMVARYSAAAILMTFLIGSAVAASSVTQHGITWTFSKDQTVGQFANGDWWVVGPVTITNIDPPASIADGMDINGTMVNPVYNTTGKPNWTPVHAWDGRLEWKSGNPKYDDALNIAKKLPYTVAVGSSIMSAKSYVATALANDQQLETIAILTVLASAPPAGSFRPPYIGGADKSIRWNKSQLRYDRLKKLTEVPYTPTFAELEPLFERAIIALSPGYASNYCIPKTHDNPEYGRAVSHKVSAAALLLNLNYSDAQKETLLIRLVQRGIDLYGVLSVDGGWWGAGGHLHGRKLPVILAGWVLDDANILAKASTNYFQEDAQHWYVTQSDVDLNSVRPADREPYTVAMIGTPEWSSDHYGAPSTAGSQWGVPYRDVVGNSLIGSVLAARIMGVQNIWNNQACFDYYDRLWQIVAIQNANISTGINSIQPFVAEMWKAYRGSGGTVIPPSPPAVVVFVIGDRIETTRSTNVRTTGTLAATLLGTQAAGAQGVIINGPVSSDNITWWQVNYDNGVDGWSGGDNFNKLVGVQIPPAAPSGLKIVK